MKPLLAIILAVLFTFTVTPAFPGTENNSTFSLSKTDVVVNEDLLITKFILTSTGERTITIQYDSNSRMIRVQPHPETNRSTAEILIFADLISVQGKQFVKYFIQPKGSGSTAGGATTIRLQDDIKLNDWITIQEPESSIPLGSEVKLGEISNDPIILKVE